MAVLAVLPALILAGCHARKTPEQNRSYETLNTIVSEVILHRKTDVYRLPYPVDAEGKNLFSNALIRLDAWARVHPGQCEDVVLYTEGLCHEKLGHLKEAADDYGRVPKGDADLPKLAPKRREVMLDLAERFRPPLKSLDPAEQDQLLQALKDRSDQAVQKYKGTEWESLAMLCSENLVVEEFLDLQTRRAEIGEGKYREAIESLIVRFPESKRIQEHRMRLGIYYEETAREWIARAEYGKQEEAWSLAQKALDKATEIYVKVSQADGYPEKREAVARLDSVESLAKKVDKSGVKPSENRVR
jgi:hypothetical protein